MPGQVILEMTGDERKVLRSLAKLEGQVKILETNLGKAGSRMKKEFNAAAQSVDKTGKSLGRAGKAGKDAFGSQAAASLKTYLGSAVSIGAAVAVITKGLREANEIRKEAAAGLKADFGSVAKLAQLSGGDAGVLREDLGQVKRLRTQFGFGKGQAANLRFQLRSLGLEKDQDLFGSIRGVVEAPSDIATGVGTLSTAFGAGAGTSRQILNKLFAASAVSKTSLGRFAPASTISAQEAGLIGTSLSEQAAIIAILSRGKKTAEVASTQVRALSKTIFKRGLGGKGILDVIPEIRRKIDPLSPEDTLTFFGRQEGFAGFLSIERDLELTRETKRAVLAAGQAPAGQGLTARNIAAFRAQPEFAAFRALEIETQRRKVKQEGKLGIAALGRERAVESVRRHTLDVNPLLGFLTRTEASVEEFFGADEQTIQTSGRRARGSEAGVLDDAFPRLINALTNAVTKLGETVGVLEAANPTRIPASGSGDFRVQTSNVLAE